MKQATIYDKQFVIRVLSAAFQNNQSINYLIPQLPGKQKRIQALMDYSFETCRLFGKVHISDDNRGCALISFPERKKTTLMSLLAEIKLIFKSIGFENISKAIQREKTISKHHPNDDIYYLWFIGVLPEFQGRGIGEKLMREILADADRMKRAVYLETSTLKNLPWYEKFGFEVYNELDFGYKLFLMRRDLSS